MTFGELWTLIERHRISPDLRVTYLDGRFGLSDKYATIFVGDAKFMNVPVGDMPLDKTIFIWDGRYSNFDDQLREATPPVGHVLKRLLDEGHIESSPRIKALIALASKATRVEIYTEDDGKNLVTTDNYKELEDAVYAQVQRDKGLIPV